MGVYDIFDGEVYAIVFYTVNIVKVHTKIVVKLTKAPTATKKILHPLFKVMILYLE